MHQRFDRLMTKWPNQRHGKKKTLSCIAGWKCCPQKLWSCIFLTQWERGKVRYLQSTVLHWSTSLLTQCSSVAASRTAQSAHQGHRGNRAMSRLQRRHTVDNCTHHHPTPQDKCIKLNHYTLQRLMTKTFSQHHIEVKGNNTQNTWCDYVQWRQLQPSFK